MKIKYDSFCNSVVTGELNDIKVAFFIDRNVDVFMGLGKIIMVISFQPYRMKKNSVLEKIQSNSSNDIDDEDDLTPFPDLFSDHTDKIDKNTRLSDFYYGIPLLFISSLVA
jgi:hypothetical protein